MFLDMSQHISVIHNNKSCILYILFQFRIAIGWQQELYAYAYPMGRRISD